MLDTTTMLTNTGTNIDKKVFINSLGIELMKAKEKQEGKRFLGFVQIIDALGEIVPRIRHLISW